MGIGIFPLGIGNGWYLLVFPGIPGIPQYSPVFVGILRYSLVFPVFTGIIPQYSPKIFPGIPQYSPVFHGIPWYSPIFTGIIPQYSPEFPVLPSCNSSVISKILNPFSVSIPEPTPTSPTICTEVRGLLALSVKRRPFALFMELLPGGSLKKSTNLSLKMHYFQCSLLGTWVTFTQRT